MAKIPIGQSESQTQEFKSRDSLKNASSIAREVVAMLNAKKGGKIWIGLKESEGRAVEVEAIDDAENAAKRLHDHLLDTIEPALTREELTVSSVEADQGRMILSIRVEPNAAKQPYCHIKNGGRHFVVRVGDRLRPMTRDELLGSRSPKERSDQDALNELATKMKHVAKTEANLFWLRLQPSPALELDIGDPMLRRLLTDATLSSNRPAGWVFANPYREPRVGPGRLLIERKWDARTVVEATGMIVFSAPLERFHWQGGEHELWPYALLEFPVSIFRLAREVYKKADSPADHEVFLGLVVCGISKWVLRAGSPKSPIYDDRDANRCDDDPLFLSRPIKFEMSEILDEPDRCAFRVIRFVYQAFGYLEEGIPMEFDRRSGRFQM